MHLLTDYGTRKRLIAVPNKCFKQQSHNQEKQRAINHKRGPELNNAALVIKRKKKEGMKREVLPFHTHSR